MYYLPKELTEWKMIALFKIFPSFISEIFCWIISHPDNNDWVLLKNQIFMSWSSKFVKFGLIGISE
jgi:hypothetical protein